MDILSCNPTLQLVVSLGYITSISILFIDIKIDFFKNLYDNVIFILLQSIRCRKGTKKYLWMLLSCSDGKNLTVSYDLLLLTLSIWLLDSVNIFKLKNS